MDEEDTSCGLAADRSLRIAVWEPYAALSHRLFWEGLRDHSRHQISVEILPPRHWKLRMRTASFHFAQRAQREVAENRPPPDLIVASEYLSIAELIGLLPPSWRGIPMVVDFHENQLTYPLQEGESRDLHFAFSHLHAGLAARKVIFHSHYHRQEFLEALPELLRPVTDVDTRELPRLFAERSVVLPLGTEVERGDLSSPTETPTVVWCHRWEYDKGPDRFLQAVQECRSRGVRFRVRLLGQRFREVPPALEKLRDLLGDDLIEGEFVADRDRYLVALAEGDLTMSTARHEFFGLSTLESLRLGLLPILPADLAYPELLPPAARQFPFLYRAGTSSADALEAGIELVRSGERSSLREEIIAFTEKFSWSEVIHQYDDLFDQVVSQGGDVPLR